MIYSIKDCVAPYTIDVLFDALSDADVDAGNSLTSCGM